MNVTRRMKSRKDDEDGNNDITITQGTNETKQKLYRYIKLILLCCCWLIFTVSNSTKTNYKCIKRHFHD